ncbi:unnamed protein product, partial [Didymodactylos carnosus]
GDWLQGPYVYALYESYSIPKHEIEILFIAGFGSSMIFGTIVASLADKYGRRNTCLMYGILYGLSCITKSFLLRFVALSKFSCIVRRSVIGCAPFDSAIISFIAMCILLVTTWSENHGDANAPISQSFISAWNAIMSDKKIFLLGAVQALFEASMYVFVLEWTPALTQALNKPVNLTDNKNPPIPHGYIFASYMVAMMMGSNSFKLLCSYRTPESFMR